MANKGQASKKSHSWAQRKKSPAIPARLPGLNFDTFEHEGGPTYEGAYGTDRAPTYQSRYAATEPKRYVRKLLSWLRGRPKRSYKARRARGSGRRHAAVRKRRRTAGGRRASSRSQKALH